MKILIIGSTGMLGKVLVAEAKSRGYEVFSASRKNSEIIINFEDINSLIYAVDIVAPDIIINAGALVNLEQCERDPGRAYIVNSRPAAVLARLATERNIYFIQISTDHYYSGHAARLHNELSSVQLLNEYARSKYAGELFALTTSRSLVVRTNIVGYKGQDKSLTFVEWVIDSLKHKREMTLFHDFYTSTITSKQLSETLFDIIGLQEIYGVINIASRGSYSKKTFIECLANRFGYHIENPILGSVHSLNGVQRADSLGLDVLKVEEIVGYNMPDLGEVVDSLYAEYQEGPRT